MPIQPLKLALWSVNLGAPLASLEHWVAGVEARLAEAREADARMLVMPEYAAEHWLAFAPRGMPPTEEIPWLADRAQDALEALRPLAARHGVALLAGTIPVRVERAAGPPFVNRAHLFLPDGRCLVQDKLCLTPAERDPAGWHLATGDSVQIVTWEGMRLAVLICLDAELPALAAALTPHALDLVLVPSMTSTLAGYSRVFGCARARAIELACAVATVGCIGRVATGAPRQGNVSAAAVYLPCEGALGERGVAAEIEARDGAEGPGPLLLSPELPLAEMRRLRAGAADVWPGAWSAARVRIVEAGTHDPQPRPAPRVATAG